MGKNIKSGDFVLLTDPISNGQIVRIENVDENGFAEWLGGSQYCDMEQISMEQINPDLLYYYKTLSDLIGHIENTLKIKLYPESAVSYWKNRAEVEEKEHAYYEQAWGKEHSKLLDAQDEIAKFKEYIKKVCAESSADIQRLDAENNKLKEELSRCRAKNAAYLREKKQAEDKVELLEKEIADLKVPESRQNRHLRDELHRSRLECQQAWESAHKEREEKEKLQKQLSDLQSAVYDWGETEDILNG